MRLVRGYARLFLYLSVYSLFHTRRSIDVVLMITRRPLTPFPMHKRRRMTSFNDGSPYHSKLTRFPWNKIEKYHFPFARSVIFACLDAAFLYGQDFRNTHSVLLVTASFSGTKARDVTLQGNTSSGDINSYGLARTDKTCYTVLPSRQLTNRPPPFTDSHTPCVRLNR